MGRTDKNQCENTRICYRLFESFEVVDLCLSPFIYSLESQELLGIGSVTFGISNFIKFT